MRKIKHKMLTIFIVSIVVIIFLAANSYAFFQIPNRMKDARQHRNGKMWSWITNFGQFGTDQDGGTYWPGSERATGHQYINRGGLILGGIISADGTGRHQPGDVDTLVSEGPAIWGAWDYREMFPHYDDERSLIEVRSTLQSSPFYHLEAVSEEDFIAVYTDTFLSSKGAEFSPGKHRRGLGLEIIEKSYQWSYSYSEDIVFFDCIIINIGKDDIKQFYIGFFADNDTYQRGAGVGRGQRDDICGFMEKNYAGETVNVAWCAEDDGDEGTMPGAVGVRILRPTTGRISFNWYMSDMDPGSSADWGPVTPDIVSGIIDPRDPLGSPVEDEDKYVTLVNGSFDPPQYNPDTKEWHPDIPAGADPNDNSRLQISFGPLGTPTGNSVQTPRGTESETIFAPGDTLYFTYAVFGGEGDPAVSKALGITDPAAWVDLGINAATAQTMFDNPGVDTDGDGYAGDDLDGDGVYDTGDGVPDFQGPPPPPSPPLTVTPEDGMVKLDWSSADPSSAGYDPTDQALPLNYRDPFVPDDPYTTEDESRDFEGFMVMRSKTGHIADYEIVAVFDIANNEFGRNTGLQYEYTDYIPNGQSYYYAVVSFDRGVPEIGLESLNSSPLNNAVMVMAGAGINVDMKNQIWVEPNPYIERSSFENLDATDPLQIEHYRVLDFCNLPAKCTIRIFTLDGDLVQTLEKDDPNNSRLRWDMLTRSIQSIASGIYFYSVKDDKDNKFVGKFVIVK